MHKCVSCGIDFECKSHRATRCLACRENAKTERSKEYRLRHSDRLAAACRKYYYESDGAGYARARRKNLRDEFLAAFGGACECCGESEPDFLTLEHRGGWGGEHRKTKPYSSQQLADAKRDGWPKDKYGILCFNCNRATSGGKTCPHKESK